LSYSRSPGSETVPDIQQKVANLHSVMNEIVAGSAVTSNAINSAIRFIIHSPSRWTGPSQRCAGRTVLACYNMAIPHLCEELPEEQKQALSQALKAPLVYTSVLIRNWHSFVKLGVNSVKCPGSYFSGFSLIPPISIGDYHHAKSPDEANIVNMVRIPLSPGLSAQEQWKAGSLDLLTTTFETFERNIRDQLGRALSPGGFDPARDIEAITVNRWPHGYAYGQNPETGEIAYQIDEVAPENAPWIAARRPFGRISIANSDAAANAMTEGAIGEAHRAVMDLISTSFLVTPE
jgi:spermidine dehydrogenase